MGVQEVAAALTKKPAAPFQWGAGGEALTPEQVATRQRMAQGLRQKQGYVPQGTWSLLGALAGEGVANMKEGEADAATKAGHEKVAAQLAESRKTGDYSGVMADEWATPGQQAVANALQSRGWQKEDQAANWAREDARYAQQQAAAAAAASKPKWETFDDGQGNIYRYNANDPAATPSMFFDGPEKASGADETFFGNPVPYQDEKGNIRFGQIGNKGSFKPIDLGDGGGKFVSPTKTVNTETEQLVMDQFGNVLSRVPIQNREAASETAIGKGLGEAQAAGQVAAPGDISNADTALDLINQIRTNPELDNATGFTAPLNNLALGTPRYDFQNLVDQAKSGAFLTAIQSMRGLGALSNAEGGAATQAITRMNTATSKDAFLKALDDYQAIVEKGKARAASKLPADSGAVDLKSKYGLE